MRAPESRAAAGRHTGAPMSSQGALSLSWRPAGLATDLQSPWRVPRAQAPGSGAVWDEETVGVLARTCSGFLRGKLSKGDEGSSDANIPAYRVVTVV
jgi:hypothetical protein